MGSSLSYILGSTSVLLFSFVAALAPVMAEGSFVPAHKYPKAAVAEMMDGCMSRRKNVDPETMQLICYCISNATQDRYTLAQLLDFSREIKVTRTLPEGMTEIAVGCARAVVRRNANQ